MILTNATVVTGERVLAGTVTIEQGLIKEVDEGPTSAAGAIDLGGDYLLPGLVELHTDNLEKQLRPRPSVNWPVDAAMLAHDSQVISAGITTVCDAVCVGYYGNKQERVGFLQGSIDAIRVGRANGLLKADHHLHLRCEIADPHVVELFEPLARTPELSLVSVMDHTPGQRQFRDIDRWKKFAGKDGVERGEKMLAERLSNQARYSDENRQRLMAIMRDVVEDRTVPLASHDDTTVEHVALAAAEGMSISEFPTTEEAARAARAAGLSIIMGAPNVVLGASQSGNVSARSLGEMDLLDALSSDYVPSSLLHAVFL
ncbi:MAG: alpha-D-ribose 1-methylphosphonate 5-triphosphate diphosphatase, partial [Pseudomonadota bacterium]